jgi:hypothetical protein
MELGFSSFNDLKKTGVVVESGLISRFYFFSSNIIHSLALVGAEIYNKASIGYITSFILRSK